MHKFLVMALMGLTATAQTQIDLATQTKRVDFSNASSTKPLQTGATLPSTCVVGQMFFNTGAPAGVNLYACTATNTWSVQGGLSGANCWADATSQTLRCQDTSGNVYAVVMTASSGTANQWVDYIGANGVPHTSQPTATAVGAVADPGGNGVPYRSGSGVATVANAAQLSGPFFCQDAGASGAYGCSLTPSISSYVAGTTYWFRANTANSGSATLNLNGLGAKAIVKLYNQSLAGGDIRAGQWVMVTYDGANMQMQSQLGNASSGSVSTVFGRSGAVTAQTGDYSTAQVTESGNLYFTNARVLAAVTANSPLSYNSSTGVFSCPTCLTSGGTVASVFGRSGAVAAQTGDYTFAQISGTVSGTQLPTTVMQTNQSNAITAGTQDFSQAAHTLSMKSGTTAAMPTTCTVGESYFATNATAGQNLYGCTATNVWSQQAGTGGSSNVTVQTSGTLVGTRNILNIVPGTGITPIVTDTGSQINIQLPIDTAVTDTRLNAVSGSDLLVLPNSGSGTTYAGCPSGITPPLTSGMVVHLVPDHNSNGGATAFNYCGTGAIALMESDGATNLTSSDLVAGRQVDTWYDGTNTKWRLKVPSASGSPGTSSTTIRIAAVVFPGGGSPLTGPQDACVDVPLSATITGITLLSDVAGSVTVDVRTVAGASYTGPASASTITASDTPALSGAARYHDTALTGWSTSVPADAVMCFHLTNPSTITWLLADVKGTAN